MEQLGVIPYVQEHITATTDEDTPPGSPSAIDTGAPSGVDRSACLALEHTKGQWMLTRTRTLPVISTCVDKLVVFTRPLVAMLLVRALPDWVS